MQQPTPEMLKAYEGYTFWGGVFINPGDYSSTPSDTSIPYICPRSNYGYKPDIRLPRYGSIDLKPEVGYSTWSDYLQGRGHRWNPYVPYNGSANAVQFSTMRNMGYKKPKRRGCLSSLFGCFCGY